MILDFATGDTIQLYGSADNYEIEESRGSVSIYMKDDGVGDLIGVVRKASLEDVNSGISFLGGESVNNDGNLK
ncbi:hypothetical protein NIES267_07830 [Calothrix parasitica NIES-267]|uniref:Uncharacterized protein n=1 Tax=Calothrix parasitica NIES-267 TaxID=1973488 RepID=A0A1Z4LJ87_9CYAN|nr:hypothetical protein NIES267_07830 [Calothrix parasitica NIES-267]